MLKKLPLIIFLILISQIFKAQNEFITIWKPNIPHPHPTLPYAGIPINSTDTQIWVPVVGTDFTIYWEEVGYPSHNATMTGVNSTYQVFIDFGTPSNPIAANATYRVKISNGSGNFHRFRASNWDLFINGDGIVGDVHKIIDIEQWGNIHWSSMEQAFQGCRNMNISATDIPDLSNVTGMQYMFTGCSSFVGNPSINDWNTSHVTDMRFAFGACSVFNQPIGDWDTSNVTVMAGMFSSAVKFNQPIGNWNTSKVIYMTAMFSTAREFNQPIGNWDLSSNLECELMFSGAWNFNQPIGDWNTSNILEMNRMFLGAKAFDQDISNWDTGKVYDMYLMFSGAENFNQDIGSWDVSKVESMYDMFNGAVKFNKDISGWDVGKVMFMQNMFKNAQSFNQNIGNWNVGMVKNMSSMFEGATAFNQDLGQWQLNALISASGMFSNSGLNCQNYDSILFGWSTNPSTPNNIYLAPVSPIIYSNPAAVAARNQLITVKNWNISGDIYNGECHSVLGTSDPVVKNEIYIYPNPASDFIHVKNSDAEDFIIYDAGGRVILKGKLSHEKINIQTLLSGNYILQLISKNGSKNFKFIKQ
ncbi:BspA family leucine-rich repeat surface protein [Chryseobacterium taichungense]|uniref:BspA family leucine-rich repeat surface protein n=1 Tax=Chryseobacterium taichungense TaxID=295069 RepID=UPI0028AE07A6|nr:BspA family leucine-rich repeat surface protein [Chryseobacterium taichungense]